LWQWHPQLGGPIIGDDGDEMAIIIELEQLLSELSTTFY
jgi:hypothetical protein